MGEVYLDTRSQIEMAYRGLADLAGSEHRLALEGGDDTRWAYAPGGGELGLRVGEMVGGLIVSDPHQGGELYAFDAVSGVWTEVTRDEFARALHFYDGRSYGHPKATAESTLMLPDGSPVRQGMLTVSDALIGAAWRQAHAIALRAGFFSAVPPSVSLSGFVLWYDPGLAQIVVCDATGETGEDEEPTRARDARCMWHVDLPDLVSKGRTHAREEILRALAEGKGQGDESSPVGIQSIRERYLGLAFWPEYLRALLVRTPHPDHAHALLQEFVGACVLGTAPRHFKRGIVLWGPPGSGKSVLLDVFGQSGGGLFFPPAMVVTGCNPGSVTEDYQRGQFQGCRLIAHDEMNALRRPRDLASYLTGQPINARHVGGKPFNLTPTGGFITSCNNPPAFWGDAAGFERRMVVIRFQGAFASATRRGRLTDEEIRSKAEAERAYLFLWALEGAARLAAKGGPTIPPDINEAWADFAAGDSFTYRWFGEALEPATDEEGIASADLWSNYCTRAAELEIPHRERTGHSAFFRELKAWYRSKTERELEKGDHRPGAANGRRRRCDFYRGIRWAEGGPYQDG